MKKSIKKCVILLVMISVVFVSLVGCGGFNEENAKKESRIELENFLKVSENGKFIAKDTEMNKIRDFTNNISEVYFTNDFINDTKNTLARTSLGNTDTTFYILSSGGELKFYNNYNINSPTIDKENETITYELEARDLLIVPSAYAYVQMKKENGKWKINKAE